MRAAHTVIVGGGAGGTLTAIALLRRATPQRPVEVTVVDPAGCGRGVAYASPQREHVLNVPAGRMSALEDEPDDLLRWSERLGCPLAPTDFAARWDFGSYLVDTLLAARRPYARLRVVLDRAVGAGDGWVDTAGSGRLDGDAVVLATGYLPRDPVWGALRAPRLLADPWAAAPAPAEHPAVVLGTGLTGVDVALSLVRRGHRRVVLLSRHGWLPTAHATQPLAVPDTADLPGTAGLTLTALQAWVRAAGRGADERAVVDALRPHTARLWAALPPADRERFLAQHLRWWDVRRHRLCPAVAAQVEDLRRSGTLEVRAGRVTAVVPREESVVLEVQGAPALAASCVVDATGPGRDPREAARHSPLWHQLLRDGTVVPDGLGLGVRTTAAGEVLSRTGAPSGLWTLGPLRGGELLETTAVPELRAQAHQLAGSVLDRVHGTVAHALAG